MNIQLTTEQEAFIHSAVADGRYDSAEEALRDAMSRWERDERKRVELLAAFTDAEADLEAGAYQDYTDGTLPLLAEELKREARAKRNQQQSA